MPSSVRACPKVPASSQLESTEDKNKTENVAMMKIIKNVTNATVISASVLAGQQLPGLS